MALRSPWARELADWPLVGRAEEFEFLQQLRRSQQSAVISGPAGVGKSRLAGMALSDAAGDGWATLAIRGSAGFAGVPLGPFRAVLGVGPSNDLADLTASLEGELVAMRSWAGLMVLADDGQDFDDASVALLHHLVAAGVILALVTTRSGTRHPAALTNLWMDGLSSRIELQNLSRQETAQLLQGSLGTRVEDHSVDRIWQVTDGNPLYVREVLLASAETGALRMVDGEWRWRGQWATDARLREIVASRLGRLDADELTAIEMLAMAGTLPLRMIAGLTTTTAIESLERRALVSFEPNNRRLEVTMAHPLHAEVVRRGIAPLRQRAIWRNLVEALGRTPSRRAADRVRLACWSFEAGIEVDPVTLALGVDASLFQIGHAIGAKLDKILPDVLVGHRVPVAPVVPTDAGRAIRLATATYERTGEVADGAALARALAWTGATDGAEAILAKLTGLATDIDDRVRMALALAWTRFWGRHDPDGAAAVLTATAEWAAGACQPALLADVYEQLAGIALNTGRPATSLAYAEQAAAALGVDISQTIAAPPAAASLAYLGRCQEAIELVDRAIPAAVERGDSDLTVPSLLFGRVGAMARQGRLDEARELAESCRDVALSIGSADGAALFGVLVGEILLREGRPASAGRVFRDAAGLFTEGDILGYRPWALTGLARARAQTGDEEGAAAALIEAKRVQEMPRHFEMSRFLAEVGLHTLAGRPDAALAAAREGACWARQAGMVVDEALALHAWLLAEPSSEAADRMADLAAVTDSELVAALATHAQALVEADPDGLVAAGNRLAALSAFWMAAEATAAAVSLYERHHQRPSAETAAQLARSFAANCEGSRSALVSTLAAATPLTNRELEVAKLVTSGRSSQEVADRLNVSRRTVESHLHHVYVKLGVTSRAALARVLDDLLADQ